MTLSRPPTMSVTVGVDPPEAEDDEPSDPQAVTPAASATTAAVVVRVRRAFMTEVLLGWGWCGGGGRRGRGSGARAGGRGVRPPGQEAVLDAGQHQLREQGQDRRDDHRGVDASGAERALAGG